MDEISAADYARYSGGSYDDPYGYYPSYEPSTVAPRSTRISDKGKEEADDDDDEPPRMSLNNDFVVKKKAKRAVSFQEPAYFVASPSGFAGGGSNNNDLIQREIIREQPDLFALFKEADGKTGSDAPIEQRAQNKRVVPYNVQHGAQLLLDAHLDGDIKLGYEALASIRKLAECDDEYTDVDPNVVIKDTFSTGVFTTKVKEVVPISILLLARFLDLTFTVSLTQDMESQPRSFKTVRVKPYRGQRLKGYQSLGCYTAVKQRLSHEPESTWRLIQIHMIRLGVQSPAFVCDLEWLETQTAAMGKVLSRQSAAPPPRAPLGGGPGTRKPPQTDK